MLVLRKTLCFCLLLFVVKFVIAEPEFPELTARVVDNAAMLSQSTEKKLNTLLKKHEQTTSNQVVVATVKDLQGYSIEQFANRLARAWRLGQEDKNNGVLLLIAKSERKVRIEVGYGLEGDLTDAISANIIQTIITPAFKQKRFDQGVSQGVKAILQAIAGSYTMQKSTKKDERGAGLVIFIFFAIAIFLLFGNGGGRGRGRHGRSGYYGYSTGGFSSGGGFGGGGFSGGGGSFGGGGASGGW